MIGKEPNFTKSPYFVDEPGNWHLKPGAPDEVVKEFNEFMEDQKQSKDDLEGPPKLEKL